MGGSKKQTVGYWYNWAMHFGWCKGPVDAFLEFRAGDKTAWSGRMTASGQININQPNLWGGEDSTSGGAGGIVGAMDIMFGEATQAPNTYLASTFGPVQSAHRGKFSTVFRGGKFGAFIANPKPVSAKIERILADWQDGVVWYPQKAVINVSSVVSPLELGPTSDGWSYKQVVSADSADYSADGYDASAWAVGQSPFASEAGHPYAGEGGFPAVKNTNWDLDTNIWIRRSFTVRKVGSFSLTIFVDNFATAWINGVLVLPRVGSIPTPGSDAFMHAINVPSGILRAGINTIAVKCEDFGTYSYAALSINDGDSSVNAMNPAHIIYDSITHADLSGEPTGMVNDASFHAAADKLYVEGFGLCTTYDSSQETPAQFQQRICDVIGGSLSQSRVDGLYYLDLIRGDYDLASLPIIGEDDVIAFEQDASVITETGNRGQAEWFDPVAKETRTTPPIFSMGNIQSAGRVIPLDTKKYPEIPVESLARRVITRDVKASAVPLNRLTLTTRATLRAARPGVNYRLQLPSEGIADMVVVIGSVAHGTATNGQMKIVAVQNIYSLPATVYVKPQDGLWEPHDTAAGASPNQRLIEAPYVEVVANLSAPDLAALPDEAGYVVAAATQPAAGTNYQLMTAAASEDYADHGAHDWCPSATVTGASDYLDTSLVIAGGSLLDRVAVGSWALWDDEIVRVDAIDVDAGTLTVGRGCADTVPTPAHAAGSRIDFIGDWGGSDQREYVGGDVIRAKLLTNAGNQLDPAAAPALTVTMNERQVRPYPPGALKINGVAYPTTVTGSFTVTWAHRNRVAQADQLVDTTTGSVTVAPNTRYGLRFLDATDTLLIERTDIGPASAAVVLNTTGDVTMELYTLDDVSTSWQRHRFTFAYTPPAETVVTAITATAYTPVYDGIIVDGGA